AAPIDPVDLDRARRKLLQADRLLVEPFKARAEEIIVAADLLARPQAAVEADPSIAEASAQAVSMAVRQYLDPAQASVMIIRPGARGSYPKVLVESSGEPVPYTVVSRDFITIPPQPMRVAVPAALPERQTATLSNGLAVVHYQVPGAAMTYVSAASSAGTTSVPAGKEGIAELAAAMAARGAAERDFQTFAKAAKDIDADVSGAADYRAAFVTLAVPAENLAAGVPLLADAVRTPRFDPAAWASLVDETLYDLGRREEDLDDLAQRVAEAQLLVPGPGEPANDRSIASVRGISREETQAFFRSLFAPAGLSFVSVGAMPVAEVAAALETSFGDWQSTAVPLPPRLRPSATFPDGQRVVFVPKPGASQSVVLIATPAPGGEEPRHAEAIAVSRLLGDDFISRINAVIREAKGYSYGTSGEVMDSVDEDSFMAIAAPVERDHTGDALADMLAGYATLLTAPVRPDEVNRTVTDTLTTIAGTAETASALFDAVRDQVGIGSTLEDAQRLRLAVAALDVDGVRAEAAGLAALGRSLIVVVGDPETVLPQLEAMGMAPETIDPGSI
ncbi:MAG: insulinase family protein, partial [Hyphomicrobiales bacterium]